MGRTGKVMRIEKRDSREGRKVRYEGREMGKFIAIMYWMR